MQQEYEKNKDYYDQFIEKPAEESRPRSRLEKKEQKPAEKKATEAA